jgi:beta-phosphoglucomutase
MKKVVIFDLDGVIVSTDEFHYQAWKRLSDKEGIYFDREINQRLRGISRMQSLEIILEKSKRHYSDAEKEELADEKNRYYRESLNYLSPSDILPGVLSVLKVLKEKGIKTAIGSSSKNAQTILKKIKLDSYFDVVIDGNNITRSKPDPEVFLLAAKGLGADPSVCIVVEDAEAGIEAAISAGMIPVGVGSAAHSKKAKYTAADLSLLAAEEFL